ncbi:hypothetical protein [Chelativorans sp. AA-79]|uniref:hypothetical protein n=1 Tax=Chelativorans sp. AA-79 TaxID=3028735 RepID=UPI0023F66FFD|nr:hypothetical protein [Chelativorans sp. AA-79]WEX10328.1 hypothetical protein PVE73_05040 [Chelativorans sp. AA-79]
MKRVSFLLAASIAVVAMVEDPAHAAPNQAECRAVDEALQQIAMGAGYEAVEIDAIRMHGIEHIAGAHVQRFEKARAAAVNALMDFMAETDGLARQFKTFCR